MAGSEELHGWTPGGELPDPNDEFAMSIFQTGIEIGLEAAADPTFNARLEEDVTKALRRAREIKQMDPIDRAALLLTDQDLE